jgi:cystathionine beta-lyase
MAGMKTFDFDALIDRRHTGSTKWDKYRGRDILPMWVADMDFRSSPAVLAALHERIEHGVFGYSHLPPPRLVDAVLSRLLRCYGWQVEPAWLVWLPGLVCGLNVTCRAIGEDGDAVLTATPVYYHLFQAPGNVRRQAITTPMACSDNYWTLDFDRLEEAVTARTRLFMLCNPHNPVGRVYTRAELLALAAFCERHDLVICSDEIHCQLILDQDKRHIPIAALDRAIAERTITLLAPSKTYNIPSLGCAFAVIADERLRERFNAAKAGIVPHVTVLGYTAALAAYRDGDAWLTELLAYLRANRAILEQAVANIPGLAMSHVEATYLAWLDTREMGLDDPAACFEQAGIGVSDGRQFRGPGFVRLNFGCPRATLEEAIRRMTDLERQRPVRSAQA